MLNIAISFILGYMIGMNGILIGTIFSGIFRTIQCDIFICNKIITTKRWYEILKLFTFTIVSTFVCIIISYNILPSILSGYFEFIKYAIVMLVVISIICICILLLLFPVKGVNLLKDIIVMLKIK